MSAYAVGGHKRNMDLVEKIQWCGEEYNLAELINEFPRHFPLVVKVTSGYLGEHAWETLSAGEVFRIHAWGRHQRLLTRESSGRYFSLPETYPVPFKLIRNGKEGPPLTLSQLIHDANVPFTIRMAPSTGDTSFHLQDDPSRIMRFGDLVVEQLYQERFIKANVIAANGRLVPNIIVIPTYVQSRVVVARGLDPEADVQWETLKKSWDNTSRRLGFEKALPKMDITMFSRQQIESCDAEGTYDVLEPNHYLSYAPLQRLEQEQAAYAVLQSHKSSPRVAETVYNIYEPVQYDQANFAAANSQPDWMRAKVTSPTSPVQSAPASSFKLKSDKPAATPAEKKHITKIQDIPENTSELSVEQMCETLHLLNMGQYEPIFKKTQIDGALLKELDEDILTNEGISVFNARKLLMFANKNWRPK